MTKLKVQSMRELRDEMIAVSRGERPAPKDAAQPGFESAEAITRLLTPENRFLLDAIRKLKPASVTALAKGVERAVPNVHRTLEKLAAAGIVRMVEARAPRRRVYPVLMVSKIRIDINPFSASDDTVKMTTRAGANRNRAARAPRRPAHA